MTCSRTPALRVVPVSLDVANAFVARHHRHHRPVVGHRFSIGAWASADSLAASEGAARPPRLCGVAVIGRPVARALDEGRLVEVTRLCTDGTANACSLLYGAAARAAAALGYFCIITYTLGAEEGASLRASGWWGEAEATPGRPWTCPSRPRDVQPSTLGTKTRWARFLSEWPDELPSLPEAPVSQLSLLEAAS